MNRFLYNMLWIAIGLGFAAVIVAALSGCAGPMVFAKEGGTPAQLEYDSYECDQQWERSAGAIAFRQDPIGNAYFGMTARGDKERCMQHKGWVRQR